MKFPRLTIAGLMIFVAVAAIAAWGWVSFARRDHTSTSVILGILLGAASWVVPLVAVCVIPRWCRCPIAPDSHEPEATPLRIADSLTSRSSIQAV